MNILLVDLDRSLEQIN